MWAWLGSVLYFGSNLFKFRRKVCGIQFKSNYNSELKSQLLVLNGYICMCVFVLYSLFYTCVRMPLGWKTNYIHTYIYTHLCTHVCTYTHIRVFSPIVCFSPSTGSYTAEKNKKKHCPLSDMYTFYPCNMSQMILWLNPGKNVRNAWPDTHFSSKNTTSLINCSTWRSLFNMMYIFVLAWD